MRDINRFVFEFMNEEDDATHIYQFMLDGATEAIQFTEEFEEMCSTMEEAYGIHDVCSPELGEDDAISYTSYEVDPEKYYELVNKWRQFFLAKDFTVGQIEDPVILQGETGEEDE